MSAVELNRVEYKVYVRGVPKWRFDTFQEAESKCKYMVRCGVAPEALSLVEVTRRVVTFDA